MSPCRFLGVSGKALVWAAGLGIFLAGGFPARPSTADTGVRGEMAKRLDEYLTRITPFGFSGACLVAEKGKIVLNKGYGMAVRSEGVPNTHETVFSVGSITKQFTAAAIMKLEMMGKLSPQDSISRFFEDVPPDKKGITLHHLLTHSAGVVPSTGPDYVPASREEVVRKILEAPLEFPPGEQFSYSNAGYTLLAAVVEKVSGKTYEAFLREHLFEPAGMAFTGYRMPDWSQKVVAHWYVGERDNGTPLEKPYPSWHLLGNGGILSTTEDMYRWHLALLGDRVLSAEAKKKIFTPYLNDYGYGWDVLRTERGLLIQHDGGSTLGSSSEIRRYMDAGIVSILFCNASFGRQTLMEVVRDKIEALIFGGDGPLPPEVRPFNRDEFRKFEGTYTLTTGGRLEIRRAGERGEIIPSGQDAVLWLVAPETADLSLYRKLNRLSASVFNAFLAGDEGPLESVLFEKERRAKRVKQLIRSRLEMFRERTGPIREARTLVSLPSTLDGQEAVKTFVEVAGKMGSLHFVLYWRDGKNIGVGPTMPPGELAIPLFQVSETECAGYRIDTATPIRLSFRMDEQGRLTGMTPSGKKGPVARFSGIKSTRAH